MGKTCLGCSSSKTNDFTGHQNYVQLVMSLCLTTLSLILGFLSIFWLLRIKRKFRHTLLLILISSQTFKSFWIWIYPLARLADGTHGPNFDSGVVLNNVGFCHATGYLFAIGNETSDFVVLMIAIHTVLMIVQPRATTDEAGLYPYRKWVYLTGFSFATITSSLAFINGTSAYVVAGGLCTLPIRPFWYRLALSWIPRYVILFFITGVALGIYIFVHVSFKNVSSDLSQSNDTITSELPGGPLSPTIATVTMEGIDWNSPMPSPSSDQTGQTAQISGEESALRARQKTIRKQLRYVFIYPLVYLLMWIIPFANHCFGYTTRYTPFILSTLSLACIDLQCAVESVVFLIREKPWRLLKSRSSISIHNSHSASRINSFCSSFFNKSRVISMQESLESPKLPDEKTGQMARRPTLHWWDSESASIDGEGNGLHKGRMARVLSLRPS